MLTFLVVIGASFAIMASILTGMVSSTLYQQRTRQATRSLEQLASSAAPFLASAQMDSLSELLTAQAGELGGRLLAVEVIQTEERNRILHFCMDEMNPDYREVLYLTYFEDMSYAQAAEVTGKTVKQITNMVYRGKKSLRRLLEREGITDAES